MTWAVFSPPGFCPPAGLHRLPSLCRAQYWGLWLIALPHGGVAGSAISSIFSPHPHRQHIDPREPCSSTLLEIKVCCTLVSGPHIPKTREKPASCLPTLSSQSLLKRKGKKKTTQQHPLAAPGVLMNSSLQGEGRLC